MAGDIATSAWAREVNAARILTELRRRPPDRGEMSSGDLMDATGMSRPTVHAAAQRLVELGWVRETSDRAGGRTQGRGRPSRVFSFTPTAGYVLGIDIGAHSVRIALADLHGETTAESQTEFDDPSISPRRRIARVRELAVDVVRQAGLRNEQVLAVCVGTSGTVDAEGVVRLRTGIPGFLGVDLHAALAQDFGEHVRVENDCNLALIGERWRGNAGAFDDVVCLLAGERLGVGMCTGGTLVRGHVNSARDLDFLSLMGRHSSEDGIASTVRHGGASMLAKMSARAEPPGPGTPGAGLYALVAGDPERVSARDVFEAARQGDTGAAAIVEEGLEAAAYALGTLTMLLAPELVVITGAVAAVGDVLIPPLRRRLAELVPRVPRVEASPLRDQAVVTGAVRLALDTAEHQYLDTLAPPPAP